MHALKWWKLSTRMVFYPDDGGSAGAPSSGGDGGGAGAAGGDPGGGDGGSVATPSSSPDGGGAGPSAPAPAVPGAPDWSNLGSADDLDYIEVAPQAAPPVIPPAEAAKPPVAPQATPQQVQPTPQAAQPQGTVPPIEAPQAPQYSASDPVGIAAGLERHRDDVLAHLAQTKFALSEADIQALETDVVAAVPQIMSRVFFESQVSMQKFLAQAVPGMVRQYQAVNGANESAEKLFFTAHPSLNPNDPSHRAAAVRIASVYRQANPDIPLQQLIAEVGPMVMSVLKLNGGAAPAVAAKPQPRGGTPFRPAVGGGGANPNPEPVSEWAGLGVNYD